MRDPLPGANDSRPSLWAAINENLRTPGQRLGTAFPLLAVAGILLICLISAIALLRLPPVEGLEQQYFDAATILYAEDGSEISRYYQQNRTWIPLVDVAPNTIEALLATEDRRFYRHNGIDPFRTIGAIVETLRGNPQGGSTLTMQLVRNVFPEVRDDFIILRKFREWFTAIRLEDRYTKDEILEAYLNTVPFVFNTFGIETAARTYFSKRASALTVPESATLVGMLKGTMYYNPVRSPERAIVRRNVVIQQMEKAGFLTADAAATAAESPLELQFRPVTHEDNHAPYFAEHVRRWLEKWAEKAGYDPYTDGLRVYTTLDPRLQAAAESAVREEAELLQRVADVSWSSPSIPFFAQAAEHYPESSSDDGRFSYFWNANPDALDRLIAGTSAYRRLVQSDVSHGDALAQLKADNVFLDSLKVSSTRLQAALVAIDPKTGHVKAWVGGRNFREDKYDHVAIAKRQPGSTFKPFVYAAALDNGYSPNDALIDQRVSYRNIGAGRTWRPGNFGGETGEAMTLRSALALSKNTITAQLTVAVGPGTVAEYARRMGIESELVEVPSIGLGTSEVSLLELTSAYATIANNGLQRDPVLVTRIEDRHGRVLENFTSAPEQAIASNVSYTLLDMLRGVVNWGTGTRIRSQYGMRGDLAGKTGTTQRGADGWFMLMHPNLVTGSWVGFNSQLITFRTTYWGQGAHNALRVVGNFMKRAEVEAARFAEPPRYVMPHSTRHRIRFAKYDSLRVVRPRAMQLDSVRYDQVRPVAVDGDLFGALGLPQDSSFASAP